MEILPSLSNWISSNFSYDDLTVREDTPDGVQNLPVTSETPDGFQTLGKGQGFLPALFSTIDNIKGKIKRNVSDLLTDTDNALTKTADIMNSDILSREKLMDPGQWIAPGAGKLTGALIGAFRPSNSKLLPSTIFTLKKDLTKPSWTTGKVDPLTDKLSDKELTKYGTPEFLLDKYLPSTKAGGNPEWLEAKEIKLADFLDSTPVATFEQDAMFVAQQARSKFTVADTFSKDQQYLLKELKGEYTRGYNLEPDIRAFRDQITSGEPIYTTRIFSTGSNGSADIEMALETIDSLTKQSSFTPEQLSKKSLNQLLGIADKVEKEIQKTEGAILDFTKARTLELNKSQGLAPGFVELKTKADFGAETHFLKHCVGAGGVDQASGDFLPKWNPITGDEIINNKGLQNSGEIYYGLSQKGAAKYISYRPEGIPVATAEIDKFGNIKQLYGARNSLIEGELRAKIEKGLQPAIEQMKALGNKKPSLRDTNLADMGFDEIADFVQGFEPE